MQDPDWVRNTGKKTIYIVFISVSDLDPDSGGLLDPDPDLESGSGSRDLKKGQKC